ncbi:MAG TPA: DNA polymerase III subunit alpha, partial [Thermoleophilia bacterium]
MKQDTKGEAIITQYSGPLIAELGLLKMDFLGLRTLTVIAKALRGIKANHGVDIDIDTIPVDDATTYKLYQRGDVDGVFQVESAGMRTVLSKLKPTVFADIVAVVALYRPGPMDSIDDFCDRKHGRRKITYYDDRIKPILEETYGAIVYQEQAMRITMEMGGFTAAKAEKLRKGMGKKKMEIVDALEPEFMAGAAERGYDLKVAKDVWTDIKKFGEYAFNKSHAAAYALISYQTAYLKAHYPREFMAALLSSYTGKTEQIVKYVAACKRGGILVLPPDVNSSGADFTAVPEGVRFGLAGIRGVGEGVVDMIVRARDAGGPFTSLHDFCERVDLRQVNKKTFEALIKAGAFDSTGYTRKHLMTLMDECVDAATKRQRDVDAGQVSLFDMDDAADHGFSDTVPPPNGDEWDKAIKLAFEKEMLGIYVSDHPLREIAPMIQKARSLSLDDADSFKDGTSGWFAGILTDVQRRLTKHGKMVLDFTLEDMDGSMPGGLFGAAYTKFEPLLVEDAIVRIKARVEVSDRGRKLLAQEVQPLDADGGFARPPGALLLEAGDKLSDPAVVAAVKDVLHRYPGPDDVKVHDIAADGHERMYTLPEQYRVDRTSNGLHAELKEILGPGSVKDQ